MRGLIIHFKADTMYNWNDTQSSHGHTLQNLIFSCISASVAITIFLIFNAEITSLNQQFPLLIPIMFAPAMILGFIYGVRITQRAVSSSEIRSPLKRSVIKIFLFFFVIGGLFSSVNFAINDGSIIPSLLTFDGDVLPWLNEFIISNGGATFLIISSIILMSAATQRLVGMDNGILNRFMTFVGVFIFFTILALSFTQSDHSVSNIFLYTFYQAGVVGGAFYAMNQLTKNQNMLNDYANGY